MANFEAQVNGLTDLGIDSTSTNPGQTELSQFLNDGVIDVTNRIIRLRPQEVDNFTRQSAEQTSNGFNPGTNKIIAVLRESGTNNEWYPCTKSSMNLEYRVTDPTSLHYASKYNPVYMISQNRNIHVFPEPSTDGNDTFKVLYVNFSPEETDGTALDYASTGIKWFPEDKIYLVILYAGIQALMAKMSGLNSALPSDITLPTVPTSPTMSTLSESLPTYIAPNALIQPSLPADADISFTSVPTAPTFNNPSEPVLTSNSLENWPSTAPTYTPPLSANPNFADADTWINTEEDNEMSAARVQVIQSQIADFSANMQSAVQEFNDANVEYQADMQESLQNAQLSQQDDTQKVQEFSAKVQAEVSRVNKDMQEYQQEIAKAIQTYQAETGYDMAKYSAELQSEIARFTNDLQNNNTTFQSSMAKFTADMGDTQRKNQETLAIYNADIQKYNFDLQGKIQEFTTRLQKDQADYQWTSQQYSSLKVQYNEAFAIMAPPAPQQQRQVTQKGR